MPLLNSFNRALGGLIPRNDLQGLLDAKAASEAQRRGRMTLASGLLQASGPSTMPRGLLQSFGAALPGALAAQDQYAKEAAFAPLESLYLQTQIARNLAPDTSSFQQKLSDVRGAIGRELTQEEVLKLAGGGTTINIGDKLNEPIPISSLDSVRLPDGSTLPIGSTYADAQRLGAQVFSSEELKKEQQADAALGILDQLETLAIGEGGEGGIFQNVNPGLVNRAGAAFDFALGMLSQNDPRASQFYDMSKATLAPFIRLLGESGALAQGDVDRALGLVPRVFPLPDTKEVAERKLIELRAIINRGVRKQNEIRERALSNGGPTNSLSSFLGISTPTVAEISAMGLDQLKSLQQNVSELSDEALEAARKRWEELNAR